MSGIVISFIGRLFLVRQMNGTMYREYDRVGGMAPESYSVKSPLAIDSMTNYEMDVDEKVTQTLDEYEYEIKKGKIELKTKQIESDYNKLKQKTIQSGGWVESMYKDENYQRIKMNSRIRIPKDNFNEFTDWMIDNFDVERANIESYRVSVEKQQDEIDILNEGLRVYEELLERVEQMNVSDSSIELAMKITKKRLEVMRLLRDYGYSIEQTEKKSDYTTIDLTLIQQKKIKVLPEDIGRDFRNKIRNAMRELVDIGTDIITQPVILIVKVIRFILYAVIILVPVFVAIRLLVKLFKWIWKKF